MSIIETPLQLQHLALKNRIIRSAVHSFLAGEDGYMTAAEYNMYEVLAKNGIGTIITGHCCVDPLGRANPEQVNIYEDCFTDQFRKAVAIAHAHDVRFIPQINHAGPRAIDNEDLVDVVARPLKKGRHARALTVGEIHHIEQCFIEAAKRLQQSGCDGVQLHAAHSYLLSRFLDPTFNQREDAYGGTIENRFRMTEEIIRGIQEACGEDFPVLLKVNVDTKAEDDITVMLVVRNDAGKLVSFEETQRQWNTMWEKDLFVGSLSSMPQKAGTYTLEIYFNHKLVTTKDFNVRES